MAQLHQVNQSLLDLAVWRINGEAEKAAFVPSDAVAASGGGDPAAGGAPPADPAAMGAGGDPMAGGGAPPSPSTSAMPPPDPMQSMMPMIQQIVQQTIQQMGLGQPTAGAPGAGGAGGAAAGGKAKVDPTLLYMEVGRCRKLLTTLFENLKFPLPPDILDDQAVAASVMGQPPQAPPLAQDPNAAAAGGAPPPQPGFPAMGTSPAIQPVQPPKQANSLLDVLGMPEVFGEPTPAKLDMQQVRLEALAKLARHQAAA